MTCIAALKHDGKVYIGADSAGVAGWDLTIRSDEKVFFKGQFIFGFTSSFRMGQLLRYTLSVPAQPEGMSDVEYMTTIFVNEARKCLKAGGFAEIDKNVEKGGFFLVGYKGEIYKIESDFQVGIAVDPYAADGCGGDFALGVLHTLASAKTNPRARLTKALETAEHFSAGVRGPFKILSL